jgi:hypothetical protein
VNQRARVINTALILLALAVPVHAGILVTFEDQPTWPTDEAHDVTVGTAQFIGGRVTAIVNDPAFSSHCFQSIYVPPDLGSSTYFPYIEVVFTNPASGISLDLWNGYPKALTYTLFDDNNNRQTVDIPAFTGGGNAANIAHVTFPYSNVHSLFIVSPATSLGYTWDFAIDNFGYTDDPCGSLSAQSTAGDPQCDLERMILEVDGELSATGVQVTHLQSVSRVMQAHIPFGARFTLGIQRRDVNGQWVPVSSVYTMINDQRDISPALPARFNDVPYVTPAYPFRVLLPFALDTPANTKRFQNVHQGAAYVYVRPQDRPVSDPPTQVSITTYLPDTLGKTGRIGRLGLNNNTLYDVRLLALAHDRGIPPQYSKG